MNKHKQAIARVANASRRYEDAFKELREATESLQKIVAEEQNQQWQIITQEPQRQERRPKGEIQDLITHIFEGPIPKPLSFQEILRAIDFRTSHRPSQSTVRQTLYRMKKKHILESYSGKWSRGEKLRLRNP